MSCMSSDYKGSLCQIKTMANIPLISGTLSEIDGDIITIVSNKDELVPLPFEQTIKISLFSKSLGFRSLVGIVYISTREVLKLTNIETLSDYERRDFFRVDIVESGSVIPYPFPDNMESFTPIPCSLHDISLSGVLVKFNDAYDLSIGNEFIVKTQLGEFLFEIHAQVTRIDFHGRAGCVFSNLSNMDSDLLYRYIIQKQSDIIRAGRLLAN